MMAKQEAEEVELSRLIDYSGHDGKQDKDGNFELSSVTDTFSSPRKQDSPPASGYSSRDVLSFLPGILAVVVISAYFFGRAISNETDSISTISFPDSTSWLNMRWQPKSTTVSGSNIINNCPAPRFQLANATIHCGIGGLSPLTNTSNGDEYCGGVKMEPNSCILPMEGCWEVLPSPDSQNATEGSIKPHLPLRLGFNTYAMKNSTLPYCKTMEDFINGTYEGNGFDQEWIPSSCRAVLLSPFAWTQNAECQRTITMIGDSHIRNLFTATVHGLRGAESFTEAHAGAGAKGKGIVESYEWRLMKDGSATDRVSVHADSTKKDLVPFQDCPCDGAEVQRCLRIAFIWAPMFDEQLSQIEYVTKWKSNIVIVAPGNAYEHTVVLSPEWTGQFDELMQHDENLQLGILRFSWGMQPHAERMEALNAWTTNGMYADRKSYLEQSAMTPPVGGKQGRKSFHFGCGLSKVDVENDNINAAEPCTDLKDTAEIRALITVHIDALWSAERAP